MLHTFLLQQEQFEAGFNNKRDVLFKFNFLEGVENVVSYFVTLPEKVSSKLRKLTIPIVPNSLCKLAAEDTEICGGGEDGKDSCPGDSGGPLQVISTVENRKQYYQIGIVSNGPQPCGVRGMFARYTRVTNYLQWILDNIT